VFLIPLLYDVGQMVLKLVVFSTADDICKRHLCTRSKTDVPADTQRKVKDAGESELKFICQALGGKEENKTG